MAERGTARSRSFQPVALALRMDRLYTKFAAVDGDVPGLSRRPRLLPADGLQREVVVFERQVVFDLVEGEARDAAALQVGHRQLARRPDALDIGDARVVQPAY